MAKKTVVNAAVLFPIVLILLLPSVVWADGPVNPGSFSKYASNPVVPVGAPGSWDASSVMAPSVLYAGGLYHMWFVGSSAPDFIGRIGHATSPDGVTWNKDSTPVLDVGVAGEWDSLRISGISVLLDGGVYKIWYAASNVDTGSGSVVQIGYATSDDGVTWSKHGSPVLAPDTTGWENGRIGYPSVVKVGGQYRMWYRGGLVGTGNTAIGYATSNDGIVWIKHSGNPVLSAGSSGDWDENIESGAVTHDGFLYHMWYSGADGTGLGQVGHAVSADGVSWTRTGIVLPNGAAGAFDALSADYASVLLQDSTYKIWYSGMDGTFYRIGYAEGAGVASHWLYIPLVLSNHGS